MSFYKKKKLFDNCIRTNAINRIEFLLNDVYNGIMEYTNNHTGAYFSVTSFDDGFVLNTNRDYTNSIFYHKNNTTHMIELVDIIACMHHDIKMKRKAVTQSIKDIERNIRRNVYYKNRPVIFNHL